MVLYGEYSGLEVVYGNVYIQMSSILAQYERKKRVSSAFILQTLALSSTHITDLMSPLVVNTHIYICMCVCVCVCV